MAHFGRLMGPAMRRLPPAQLERLKLAMAADLDFNRRFAE
jgi:hypothetical protein